MGLDVQGAVMLTMILMLTLAYHDLNCTRELIRLMSETTCLFSESGLQGDDLLKQEQKIVISSHGIRSEVCMQ